MSRVNASSIRAPCALPRNTSRQRGAALLQQHAIVERTGRVDDAPQAAAACARSRRSTARIASASPLSASRTCMRAPSASHAADHLTCASSRRTPPGQHDVARAATDQPTRGVQAERAQAAGDPVGRIGMHQRCRGDVGGGARRAQHQLADVARLRHQAECVGGLRELEHPHRQRPQRSAQPERSEQLVEQRTQQVAIGVRLVAEVVRRSSAHRGGASRNSSPVHTCRACPVRGNSPRCRARRRWPR